MIPDCVGPSVRPLIWPKCYHHQVAAPLRKNASTGVSVESCAGMQLSAVSGHSVAASLPTGAGLSILALASSNQPGMMIVGLMASMLIVAMSRLWEKERFDLCGAFAFVAPSSRCVKGGDGVLPAPLASGRLKADNLAHGLAATGAWLSTTDKKHAKFGRHAVFRFKTCCSARPQERSDDSRPVGAGSPSCGMRGVDHGIVVEAY